MKGVVMHSICFQIKQDRVVLHPFFNAIKFPYFAKLLDLTVSVFPFYKSRMTSDS